VDLFFALCVPAEARQEHLDLLAALAGKLSDGSFVARLRAAAEPAAVFAELTADGPGGG
jgi:mannitol/fructose-specific phosphotransferase system IIA component (Ntr-type)